MSQKSLDAQMLRAIAVPDSATSRVLERVASQLDYESKQDEKYEALQAIGKSAFDSIAEMVAALECDYDRLEELATERAEFMREWLAANPDAELASAPAMGDELTELLAVAGDCTDREDAEQRIQEDPLSVQVRNGWYSPSTGDRSGNVGEEFEILLGTGGPATRIIGDLNEHGEPMRARLQAQDWGTQWTDYRGGDSETLLTYCRCFYFGEG